MEHIPKVFVSSTTADLGSYRRAASDALSMDNRCIPVLQNYFGADHRPLPDQIREKIANCDAVICLVGPRYGEEPLPLPTETPRRSYTQLEYEFAVGLKKPIFLFVAPPECPLDPDHAARPESEDLSQLQAEYVERLKLTNRRRESFRTVDELTRIIAGIRFDEVSLRETTSHLTVLFAAEVQDAGQLRRELGDVPYVQMVGKPFHDLVSNLLGNCRGTKIREVTSDRANATCARTSDAVNAALELHDGLRRIAQPGRPIQCRIAIHLGEVTMFQGQQSGPALQVGHAFDVCNRLLHLSVGGQTLLSRAAFDNAREAAGGLRDASERHSSVAWLAHGRYVFPDTPDAVDVCEVGIEGSAPLNAPPDSTYAQRADSLEEQRMQGWRPSVGQEIPERAAWKIAEKLGEGGFGEVWLARHIKTKQARVFKFCFDAYCLQAFKRELTLFRLLKQVLGPRDDIAGLLDVRLDEAPFFLESEFIDGGNLRIWADRCGGIASISLADRVGIVAQVARAVAAAHSVGIIHRDLKPANIFMRLDQDGPARPLLADFGIGAIAERAALEKAGITSAGFSEGSLLNAGSSLSGTRLYQPPEAQAGAPATMQGDVYALGILLYQMVVGDFSRPMGMGWEREFNDPKLRDRMLASGPPAAGLTLPTQDAAADEKDEPSTAELGLDLLRGDIAACVEQDLERRLATAQELAERLDNLASRVRSVLEKRRAETAASAERERVAAALQAAEAAARRQSLRRRQLRLAVAVAVGFAVLSMISVFQRNSAVENAELAEKRRVVAEQAQADATANWERAQTAGALAEKRRVDAEKSEKQAEERRVVAEAAEAKANQNAELAEASEQDARREAESAFDTLKSVTDLIQTELEPIREASRARRNLLKHLLTRLDTLSKTRIEKTMLDRSTCIVLTMMADITMQSPNAAPERNEQGGEESAPQTALRFYRRAFDIAEKIAEANPDDTQAQRHLAVLYFKLGGVYLDLMQSEQAVECFQKDVAISSRIAEIAPDNVVFQRDLAISYNRFGDLHLKSGRVEAALGYYEDALEIRRKLADSSQDKRARRDLSDSFLKIGNAHLRNRKLDAAVEFYEQALTARRKVAEEAGAGDAESQIDMLVALEKMGDTYLLRGQPDTAIKYFGEQLVSSQNLVKLNPRSWQFQEILSISNEKMGRANLQMDQMRPALRYYTDWMLIRRKLTDAYPLDETAQQILAESYDILADIQLRLNQTDQSLQFCHDALSIRQKLVAADKRNTRLARDVAQSHLKLGRLQVQRTDYPASIAQFEAAANIFVSIESRTPQDLYNAARCFALCAKPILGGNIEPTDDARVTRERYIASALECLRLAIKRGYDELDEMRSDPDLEALRGSSEFRLLLPTTNDERPEK